jgi:hypothetical protein
MKELLFVILMICTLGCKPGSSKNISSSENEIIAKEVRAIAESMLKSFEKLSPGYFNFLDSSSFLWMNNETIENYSEYKKETEDFIIQSQKSGLRL